MDDNEPFSFTGRRRDEWFNAGLISRTSQSDSHGGISPSSPFYNMPTPHKSPTESYTHTELNAMGRIIYNQRRTRSLLPLPPAPGEAATSSLWERRGSDPTVPEGYGQHAGAAQQQAATVTDSAGREDERANAAIGLLKLSTPAEMLVENDDCCGDKGSMTSTSLPIVATTSANCSYCLQSNAVITPLFQKTSLDNTRINAEMVPAKMPGSWPSEMLLLPTQPSQSPGSICPTQTATPSPQNLVFSEAFGVAQNEESLQRMNYELHKLRQQYERVIARMGEANGHTDTWLSERFDALVSAFMLLFIGRKLDALDVGGHGDPM
ncbi:hypothetical protein PT974_12187 [Cladobotryum mycophilum]|uniref:Uncharacterized protein n=1 Tax=Cladobotryum mycophilum TaxID=491253 RepID=A0ABR0S8B2_9HYPO